MDRDKRWDRVEKAYRTIVSGDGERADDPLQAVEAAYARGETDEFVLPTAIADYSGMQDGDGVLIANFRADRVREIAAALLDPDFSGFAREKRSRVLPPRSASSSIRPSSTDFSRRCSRPRISTIPLARWFPRAGLTQLRIAETEKYAHVTFFFNGGRETVFPGEERILVPSPKVATYDQQPEMSAPEVTDKVVEAIRSRTASTSSC